MKKMNNYEEKLYEATERFSIKTVDGLIDDVTAIKEIEKKYGRDIALKVWKDCKGKK